MNYKLFVLLSLVQQGFTDITCHSEEQYVGETGKLTCEYLEGFNHKLSYWHRGRRDTQWKQICRCIQHRGCTLTESKIKYSCILRPGKVFLFIYRSNLDDGGKYKFDFVSEGKSQEREIRYRVKEHPTTVATLTVNVDTDKQNKEQNGSRKGHIDGKMVALVVIVVLAITAVAFIMYVAFLRNSDRDIGNTRRQDIPLVHLPQADSGQ